MAWLNAKYSIIKVISPHVVELDVTSRIWPRFHVQLLKRAGNNPLPSQNKDDEQPLPVVPQTLNGEQSSEPEQFFERILRAERMRRGKKWVRRVLVKWKGFVEPNWEDRDHLEDNEALDKFEALYGKNDGVGESEDARPGRKLRNKNNYTKSKKK